MSEYSILWIFYEEILLFPDEDGNSEFRIRKSAASRRLARLKNIAANNPENTFSTDRSDIHPKREPVATKSNGKTGRPKAATVSDSDSEGDAHSEERLEVNLSICYIIFCHLFTK